MSEPRQKDDIYNKYQNLCADLNMNKEAIEGAWRTYVKINGQYTLEGNQIHWLACSLYIACRSGKIPTVGKDYFIEGNCVSLARLLRSSKLSFINFFNKIKKWSEMAGLPEAMRDRINHLERNFNVSTIIFKKFEPIYNLIFKNPSTDPARQVRSRKQRKFPCTSSEVFSFCWTLYVYIKGHFPAISDDLVNSYHVLLCCLDLIFNNALVANLTDLINPEFPVPSRSTTEDTVCIISYLCQHHAGLDLEAKGIKEHYWKSGIRNLLERGILKGRLDNCTGLLELANFEANKKAINKKYEEHVLSIGDFDERIFLDANADEEIGTPASTNKSSQELLLQEMHQRLTPLTNREYLKARENGLITPVTIATQSVQRLQAMLAGFTNAPGEVLKKILKDSEGNILEKAIKERVEDMGRSFCSAYTQMTEDFPAMHIDFALKRLRLAERLYYKCLEGILNQEKQKQPQEHLLKYLEHDIFQQSLFACCIEIILFISNSQSCHRKFPWIIQVFDIQPYHFYKVIALVIRAEEMLSRDVVKHLNHVEEQILESMAWKSDSVLWDSMKEANNQIPTNEEVTLPNPPTNHLLVSPMTNSVIRQFKAIDPRDLLSPGGASLITRYHSPGVKRKLFDTASPSMPNRIIANASTNQSNQSTPTQYTIHVNNASGQVQLVQVSPIVRASGPVKSKKTGSLALFFRKVYYLAWVRMKHLCEQINITQDDFRKRIFTFFEHILTHHTSMMKDRHLDQIIMCTIYVTCKLFNQERTFHIIMKSYRLQPQAASHVYRNVLLSSPDRPVGENGNTNDNGESSSSPKIKEENCELRSSSTLPQSNSEPPTPNSDSQFEFEEMRGDLVSFYNSVFLKPLHKYITDYQQMDTPPLSPLPKTNTNQNSPYRRTVSSQHSLYISPLKSYTYPKSPLRPMSYSFNRGQTQELRNINNMVKMGNEKKMGKRILQDQDSELPPAKRNDITLSKLQELVTERKQGQIALKQSEAE